MKQITPFHPLVAILFMTLAACTHEESEQIALGNEIKLTSKITSVSRSTSQNLQSVRIVEEQQVGITIMGASSEHNNVCWTAQADGKLRNTNSPVYWYGNSITIQAYHPYYTEWEGNNHTFSVHTDQSKDKDYLNSDLLWTSATSTHTDMPINLAFKHKLAKVNVTLTSDDIKDMSNAIISICGTKTSVDFDPTTGQLGTASNVTDIKAAITTTDAYTASAIIVPQTIAQGSKLIKISLSGKDYFYTLPKDMTFESGKSYHYTLNIKQSNVENPKEDEESEW